MKKAKKFIVKLYNDLFESPKKGETNRSLVIDEETGKLSWSEGKKPLGEGPDEKEIAEAMKEKPFSLEDDKQAGTRMFRPIPNQHEPYRKNRFSIEFPGIPEYFFNSYVYMGTDVHSKKKLLTSGAVIKDDYSAFKVLMLFPHEFDICEKLKELEDNPVVGDVKVNMLDPTGVTVKTIIIPDCEVTEIRAFRELSYGDCGDKKDSVLYGDIIVKHKQRKLI